MIVHSRPKLIHCSPTHIKMISTNLQRCTHNDDQINYFCLHYLDIVRISIEVCLCAYALRRQMQNLSLIFLSVYVAIFKTIYKEKENSAKKVLTHIFSFPIIPIILVILTYYKTTKQRSPIIHPTQIEFF